MGHIRAADSGAAGISFRRALFLAGAAPPWRGPVAAIVVAAGLNFSRLASGHVRKNEALATSGPYAYAQSAVPGSLLMGLGFAVAARAVGGWALCWS